MFQTVPGRPVPFTVVPDPSRRGGSQREGSFRQGRKGVRPSLGTRCLIWQSGGLLFWVSEVVSEVVSVNRLRSVSVRVQVPDPFEGQERRPPTFRGQVQTLDVGRGCCSGTRVLNPTCPIHTYSLFLQLSLPFLTGQNSRNIFGESCLRASREV